ncbi:hypothetical protein ACFV8Z_52915 [Streptomyces sp. NPDC059837]|uniref:hypothetical protein n=1 Tax=Streptomyces sp. NPDC059837 TaxID=3346968 RepID=UPI003650C48B
MSADLEQARVAARDTESPHLLGNYEGLRSDPQALVGLLATADKRTDAVIRDVGDVRARLMDDPNLPPVQLPPWLPSGRCPPSTCCATWPTSWTRTSASSCACPVASGAPAGRSPTAGFSPSTRWTPQRPAGRH